MKASQTRHSQTPAKIVGAIGGLVAGYVLWLAGHFDRRVPYHGQPVGFGGAVAVGSAGGRRGSGGHAACVGAVGIRRGVRVRPADTSGRAGVGACWPTSTFETVRASCAGCPTGFRGRDIVAASPSYWLASKQNSISCRRSRWPPAAARSRR